VSKWSNYGLDELTWSASSGQQQDITRVLGPWSSTVKCKQRPLKSFRPGFCSSYWIFLPLFLQVFM